MPNQPKTPISSFRLDERTKERLRRLSETMNTTMTEAISKATAAMDSLNLSVKTADLDASEYPFEAYTEGLLAYRDALNIEPGVVLPKEVDDVVEAIITATWPIICADKIDAERRRGLVDTIQRLEGVEQSGDVSPEVVRHFRGLLNAHDEARRGV